MIHKLSLTLLAAGVLLLWAVVSAADAAAGSMFQPFSGRMTVGVVGALVTGILMTVTGLAGLLADYEQQ